MKGVDVMGLPPGIHDYQERPKSLPKDAFWDQVRRTIGGAPLPEEQLDMLFGLIRHGCAFEEHDFVLDLGCGNGRLASEFFEEIGNYVGVDVSEVLVGIAKENFANPPRVEFQCQEALAYVTGMENGSSVTVTVIFGVIQYLPKDDAAKLFRVLRRRCPNLRRIYVGAVPEFSRARRFFGDAPLPRLDDHTSAIGCWYDREELVDTARSAGFRCEIQETPESYFQSHYRFNGILYPSD